MSMSVVTAVLLSLIVPATPEMEAATALAQVQGGAPLGLHAGHHPVPPPVTIGYMQIRAWETPDGGHHIVIYNPLGESIVGVSGANNSNWLWFKITR